MTQHSSLTAEKNLTSPTLDALCNDLDSFINELSISEPSSNNNNNSISHLNLDTATALDETGMDYYTTTRASTPLDDESPGYSPVLENYTSFYAEEIQQEIKQEKPVPPTTKTMTRSDSLSSNIHQININRNNSLNSENSNTTSSSSPLNNHLSPPVSPSFLRPEFMATKEDVLFAPRSSSLNRAMSTTSNKSIVKLSQRNNSLSNNQQPGSPLFSNPTSPLASFVHPNALYNNNVDEFPNHAFVSYITPHLTEAVARLNERRRIFCTAEYSLSFNGEEALDLIRSFLPSNLDDWIYLDYARSLMRNNVIHPIAYSEKSIRNNKLYDSPTEIYTINEDEDVEAIQCVYTPLTRCYTNSCFPGQGGCYAPLCPNKAEKGLSTAASIGSSTSHETSQSRAWSENVPKDVLLSMPGDEIKRQEAIHELIYTEDDYVRDLKLLDQVYAKELLQAQCIEESRRQSFCQTLFNNYEEILDIHQRLVNELKDYQSYCQSQSSVGIVERVGDIFLNHTHRFMNAYLKYAPHVILSEYFSKKEYDTNIVFQNFIRSQEKLAECRKLPFRHFLILPVTRLQRYVLLLGAVVKKTPDGHSDKRDIQKCIDIVKNVASASDEKTLQTKNTLRIYEINDRLRYKLINGEQCNLDLVKPGRKLWLEGVLGKKQHLDQVGMQVFLFDHVLLITKIKKVSSGKDVEYHVTKQPIPLELLHLQEATEGFSIGVRTMSSTANGTNGGTMMSSNSQDSTLVNMPLTTGGSYPLVFQHLGRQGTEHMLYAENSQVRLSWKENIVMAKAQLENLYPEKRVFEIRSLSDTTFAGSNSSSASSSIHNHGKVICTVPFMGATGIRMVAIGTQHGVWMGIEGDTNTISLVLTINDVNQIAVLEDHNIFLVLSDKTLYAYALDSLVPKENRKVALEKPHQKIATHITFFYAGVCNNRTLVIAMKKRGVDSHFKAMEPVCGDLRNPKNAKFFTKTGLFNKMPSWFKNYTEFYVGTESYALHFLKARVAIVCSRGFEIINLEALNTNRNLPDPDHPDFSFIKRREDLHPLGMFKCKQHYLLCYSEFVFMVDVHGGLVPGTRVVEWEGTPQSVAFYYPYVIGFDNRFIEVRNVETGELVQVLAGFHMRCLQFVNQSIAPVIHGCMAHPFKPDYQYIFQLVGMFEPPI